MKYLILSCALLLPLFNYAQDSLAIKEAEQQLQKNNLILLAEQYNISASQAAVIQARIWDQPYISSEFNALNPQDNKAFDVGKTGQKAVAIQQLIYLGGKKRNEVAFAKSNVAIAELQFEQLLRNLKYQLSQTFYSVYYDKQKVTNIEAQVNKLDTLLINYRIQADRGNVALKEVVRLQSLVLNLKNERNDLVESILQEQQTLSLLTGIIDPVVPVVNELELIDKYQKTEVIKDSLASYVIANNLEYLTAIKIAESQELYLRWQRSLAVPDVTLGAAYDQRGGAFLNQVNITVGIPLPLWNKNKGNIKIVESQVMQTNLNRNYKKLELQTQFETFWQLWLQQQIQLNSINAAVTQNLEAVYHGMVNNFQKRNISLMEFTDFMESYNQTTLQVNEIKKSWILACLNLNYITNKEVF